MRDFKDNLRFNTKNWHRCLKWNKYFYSLHKEQIIFDDIKSNRDRGLEWKVEET